ncbi:hypothetical protein C4F50_09660 [Flavobacterium sp. KB82]|uniref:Lipoprotein n=2 Tax=Flavobacterium hungaricum TaxID=2082725 RepID=A0ABR9TKM4_9FLAO|nr:hypothetical protein [Flavobacterium hungaricum]
MNNKKLDLTQKIAIVIPILFFLSCFTKRFIERFRMSNDFRWIYEYGSFGTLLLCIFLVIFSFANSILMLRDLKAKWQQKTLWLLLSSSIFLLVLGLMMTLF